jgi:hypothetical protein
MNARKTELVVVYHNFYPNYSIVGNKGGYKNFREIFNSLKEANDFISKLSPEYIVSKVYRRKIK